ncbi:TetR/AcrR family transcriptional regulator [Streptomyces atratus]|uniref:Transcriptional regulator, TetR family n=1 Tax=Streptomyces atratus TaxID=1893 RepID=A0A1K1UB30_STRAR|nr:helix-turn-helix domain-containing protein [Streptomyces atratus]SFX10038.1 transcriptional regulator, TetR family [Streptomyces atratus]
MAENRSPDAGRRSERSRRAIHDAALALVAEVGYPRTTIDAIAARAGVGKQTIYRWYHRWLLRTLPLTHEYADAIVDHALRGLAP